MVPPPPQLQQSFAHQAPGQIQQRNPPDTEGYYEYRDSGAITSPVQPYSGGIANHQQWHNTAQPVQDHMQSWLSSAASSNPWPPSYAPTSSYDPQIYGAMPGVQQPSTAPSPYSGSLADTSMWGVRYNQNRTILGQPSKPPLPPRPPSATQYAPNQYVPQFTPPVYTSQAPAQQPNTNQTLTSCNLPTVDHSQDLHGQYPLPPPPPPKTPQYHQDLSIDNRLPQSPQSMYHHQSSHQFYPSNVQKVSQLVEEPQYHEYHTPDSYQHTSPSPPRYPTNTYRPSAPAYQYQDNSHDYSAQPLFTQPIVAPSSPNGQRRSKWASIAEQSYPPVVSPPLPDHAALVHRRDTPSTVMTTMPPSPTSTLDYEPQQQPHDVAHGSGWPQQPGSCRSFDRVCRTCGQPKSDHGVCQFCGNLENSHTRGQYMQGHDELLLQQNRESENQSMTGHTEVPGGVTRNQSSHTHKAVAINTQSIPDVKGALDSDKTAARASVGSAGVSAASALGYGGPSDWEHFGLPAEDEIDDTYLFDPKPNVVILPTDAAELPSKSTPPPNVHEQERAKQSRIEPEHVPLLSPLGALPTEASYSTASQLIVHPDLPPLPVPQPAVAVARTGPLPPTRSTSEQIFTQDSHSEQQTIDEAMVAGFEESEVSRIQGHPVLPIHGNVIHQQQASSQFQANVAPQQVESGHIEAKLPDQTEAKPTATQAIVLHSEEESDKRTLPMFPVDVLISKPTEHDKKELQHQTLDPYSDLDSWAKASLSRFVVMLRSEANARTDKEKLDVFTSFMSKESLLRAVLYGAMSDLSADGTNRLALPALEPKRATIMEAKPSSDVLRSPSQTVLTSSPLVDASSSHGDTPTLPPEVLLAGPERSVSPTQPPEPSTTQTLIRRESSPHRVGPLIPAQDSILMVDSGNARHDEDLSPQLRDRSAQRVKPSLSNIGTNQPERDLAALHEPTPLETGSKAVSQPITIRKEQSTLAISIPEPYKDPEPEDDIEYSPGGRPIVSRPGRDPTRGEQGSDFDPRHALPSQEVTKKASATQSHHKTASHSPSADAPIVVDMAGESQTSIYTTADAAPRSSSAMSTEIANEQTAYSRYRRTASFSSAFEQEPFSQSKYKAYSASNKISLDAGITVRNESPDTKERDALNLASQQSEAQDPRGLTRAIDALRNILPPECTPDPTTRNREEVTAAKHEIENVLDDFGFIKKTVVGWDAETKKTRESNERDRRLRQEQSEERIDGLFHDNEIGYSDIGTLEAEFKKIEAEKRAQEERDEHESFVRNVFDVVTGKIEREINYLSNHYNSFEDFLGHTIACKETFNLQEERLEISQVLEVVLILHAKLEIRHRKLVEAALEKDRRFRKTQLAPLYAEGKITEMKKLEKRLDLTEREVILEAARRRNERANKLIHVVDEHSLRGIKDNQDYTKAISERIRAVSEAMSHGFNMDDLTDLRPHLTLASSYVSYLLANTLRLTQQSNAADVILNDADYDVSVAEAKVASADSETFTRLREEKNQEDAKLTEDLEQRVSAVKTDSDFVTEQIEALAVRVKNVEENGREDGKPSTHETNFEHESRMQRALEEAKERNSGRSNNGEDFS